MANHPLPAFAAEFINAKNRHDGAAVTACFTPDAVVRDEGETHAGHAGIRRWIDEANEKYKVSFEFLSYEEEGNKALLTLMVSGDFEGSPLPLAYKMTVKGGKIAELEITLSEEA